VAFDYYGTAFTIKEGHCMQGADKDSVFFPGDAAGDSCLVKRLLYTVCCMKKTEQTSQKKESRDTDSVCFPVSE